jgi:hypothetical protein
MPPLSLLAVAGVRSLLSRMVHHQQGAGGAYSFDLVNLCTTFGSDPFVMSFAQVGSRGSHAGTGVGAGAAATGSNIWLNILAASPLDVQLLMPRPLCLQLFCGGDGDASGGFESRLPVAASSFRDFCRQGPLAAALLCGRKSSQRWLPSGKLRAVWISQCLPLLMSSSLAATTTTAAAAGVLCTSASPRRSPQPCKPTWHCTAPDRQGPAVTAACCLMPPPAAVAAACCCCWQE